MDLDARYLPPGFVRFFQDPGQGAAVIFEHVLGTDNLGRDIFTRVVLGTSGALKVATTVVVASILFVALLGLDNDVEVVGSFPSGIPTPSLPGVGLDQVLMLIGPAVAVALLGEGYGRMRAFSIAALTGLVEPVGGLIGAAVISVSEPFLPWGLAFAAGAMLYVISHEIVPETHRSGHQNKATLGLAIGLVLMLFLDVWLG